MLDEFRSWRHPGDRGHQDRFDPGGDTVTFTITAQNRGVEPLTSVMVNDNFLERADGTPLTLTSGPTFVSNSGSSPEGRLGAGEIATFEATYTLVQEDVDAGGIANQAIVEGFVRVRRSVQRLFQRYHGDAGTANRGQYTSKPFA